MPGRLCRYCPKTFQSSKYQPAQAVCGDADCQRRRRNDYHRQKIATDPEYRQVCVDSPRKWRGRNPDYWTRYRAKNPASAEQNRARQRQRDEKCRLCRLAKNNSVLDLKRSAKDLATRLRRGTSCKQQLSSRESPCIRGCRPPLDHLAAILQTTTLW